MIKTFESLNNKTKQKKLATFMNIKRKMEENTTKDKYQNFQPQSPPQYPKIIDVKETIETVCHLSPNSLYSSSSTRQRTKSEENTDVHITATSEEQVKGLFEMINLSKIHNRTITHGNNLTLDYHLILYLGCCRCP